VTTGNWLGMARVGLVILGGRWWSGDLGYPAHKPRFGSRTTPIGRDSPRGLNFIFVCVCHPIALAADSVGDQINLPARANHGHAIYLRATFPTASLHFCGCSPPRVPVVHPLSICHPRLSLQTRPIAIPTLPPFAVSCRVAALNPGCPDSHKEGAGI
jgi:hypothetical protein